MGVALLIAVGALTLTRSPPRVVRATPRAGIFLTNVDGDTEICQAHEALPAGVTAIRLSLVAFFGSRVRVTASAGPRVFAEGGRGPDWTSTSVAIPVKPLSRAVSDVKLCFTLGPNSEPIRIAGFPAPPREAATVGGRPLDGRVGVEYLAAGRGTWWSRILALARHMGLGHALAGTWVAALVAALVAAGGLLALRLAWRELP